MSITKTKFLNYSRCPRYVGLCDLKKDKLDSVVTYEDYKLEELEEELSSFLGLMYEGDNDLIDKKNEHLEVMLPYYNQVELLAGNLAPNYFDGTFKFSGNTRNQESFDFKRNGIRYISYVDIYNETKDAFRIIEVKATTSNKFLKLGTKVNKKFQSIFQKKADGIYYLLEDLNLPIENMMDVEIYEKQKEKLTDRFSNVGKYVYDLAVQRYMIERDLEAQEKETMKPKIKYYLAVLNHRYCYTGGEFGDYPTDENGEDIVTFFDMTSVTKKMQEGLSDDFDRVEKSIQEFTVNEYPIGTYCEYQKTSKCKMIPVCWDHIPKKNSIFQYLDKHYGFGEGKEKRTVYELANAGYTHMLDVPDKLLTREKNRIQKEVVKTENPYVDIEKMREAIKKITYPIYHLDFETFPCPLPRYEKEYCYTQSVFQFSLHIEKEEGVCDKEKDHVEYLAPDHLDHRLDLVKALCDAIDTSSGTILVYNASFEKTRLKELADIYPDYREKLLKMRDMIFDLMDVIKTNHKLYLELGFPEERAKLFNYYHKDMCGSFSIKKILPLFSKLTYQGMEIGNGIDALVTYANFPKYQEKEYAHKYQKLLEYCKQDTWAMVEILWGLREFIKEEK
ncbi:MAG: DUF2779 domain-containing protein [Firmicutes bacterium]|nr:DUF2779 domain-containing protein [Bacillota bacterium]